MKIVVELAGYAVFATVLFGLVLGFFLLRAYLYKPGAVAPHPPRRQPPDKAGSAAREALEQVKGRRLQSQGAEREGLEREERRLETRIAHLEKQVYANEMAYGMAFKRQEVAWLRWKELHDRAALRGKKLEPEMRELLRDAEREFRGLASMVQDEWHKLSAHDLIPIPYNPTALARRPRPGSSPCWTRLPLPTLSKLLTVS